MTTMWLLAALAATWPIRFGVADTHVHVPAPAYAIAEQVLDEAGIAWALNLSGMWPEKPLQNHLDRAQASGRFLVACNLPWQMAHHEAFVSGSVKLLERCKAMGARALKVSKVLGLGARDAEGRLLTVDAPMLNPIWAAAGRLGLPVVIHTADPKAFWEPADPSNERWAELSAHPGWSYAGKEVPAFKTLLDQLTRVFERHPETTFVAVHFGNNAEDPQWVGRILDAHANVYVDLSARVPELGRHAPGPLQALFLRHARRILFASDLQIAGPKSVVLGSSGQTPDPIESANRYFQILYGWLSTPKTLPSPTPIQGDWPITGIAVQASSLRLILRENAERLFGRPEGAPRPFYLWFRP